MQKVYSNYLIDVAELTESAERHVFERTSTICQAREIPWNQKVKCDFAMLGRVTFLHRKVDDERGIIGIREPKKDSQSPEDYPFNMQETIKDIIYNSEEYRVDAHRGCTPFKSVPTMETLEGIIEGIAMDKADYIHRQVPGLDIDLGEDYRGTRKRTHQQISVEGRFMTAQVLF